MKKFITISLSSFAFAGAAFGQDVAPAAIRYVPFECGVVHEKGKPNEILAGAPKYSLNCDVRAGGVSGSGESCTLVASHPMLPGNPPPTQIPLEEVSDGRGVSVLKGGGDAVHIKWNGTNAQPMATAEVYLGLKAETECREVQLTR